MKIKAKGCLGLGKVKGMQQDPYQLVRPRGLVSVWLRIGISQEWNYHPLEIDLTQVDISYERYETSLWRVHKFH